MYNHNKAQQSKNRVHISWDILYGVSIVSSNLDLRPISISATLHAVLYYTVKRLITVYEIMMIHMM